MFPALKQIYPKAFQRGLIRSKRINFFKKGKETRKNAIRTRVL